MCQTTFCHRMVAASGLIACIIVTATASPATAQCGNSFSAWLDGFRQEAAGAGVSKHTIDSALSGVAPSQTVINRDRKQGVFAQSFLKFSSRMVAQYRLDQGRANLKKHKSLFARIEQEYGVPGPVISGFWGLETDFGANTGDFPTIRALATLAHDCRRPELFRPQLMDALRLIDNGDLGVHEMRGAWAGELGQMQFLPSDYYESAVDYDGDGRRNLIRSAPDALASTANVLARFGWRRGEPWLQEVRIPDTLPWDQADLAIRHPRSQWVAWGVKPAYGKLPADALPSALLLPMGRNGPAFLAYPNFDVYLNWNQSLVYSTTAAYFATRLAGAPKVGRGRAEVTPLSLQQTKQLQTILVDRGYDVGKIDGVIGARTRAAVKDVQKKLGLPADSYPTPGLLARLQ